MDRLVATSWFHDGEDEWQLRGDVTDTLFAVVHRVGGSYTVRCGVVPAVGEWPVVAVRPTLEDAQRVGDRLAYHEAVGRHAPSPPPGATA